MSLNPRLNILSKELENWVCNFLVCVIEMDKLRGQYAGVLMHKDGSLKSPLKGPKQFFGWLVSPVVVLAEALIFIPHEVSKRYD